MDIREQLPDILPLAVRWAEEMNEVGRARGELLDDDRQKTALDAGVARPEKIRILQTAQMPQPDHPLLREAAHSPYDSFSPPILKRRARCWISFTVLLPLTGVNKTVIIDKTPWRFGVQHWHCAEQPDPFGPDYQFRLQVSPVVPLPW